MSVDPRRFYAVPTLTGTPAWCAEHIYFSSRVPTANPGQFRPEMIAAACRPGGPLEALDNPEVETVAIRKGAQTGMTTTAYCWLAKCQATDPSSALVVMNSEKDAKEKSDSTWRPMFEDSPRLRPLMPTNKRRDWTKLYQKICGSGVYWVGANSPGRLGSKPIRRLILDEVDKYPQQTAREAGAVQLAVQRVKTFRKKGLAKIVIFSTPTTETGDMEQAYQQGDQRHLYVPCPACGMMQRLRWPQFRVDMTADPGVAVAGAHYECEGCHAPWNDQARYTAIERGEWRPSVAPKDPTCQSFHYPSQLSHFVTHKYLAAQWIKAQATRSGLQDFINSELGEPYVNFEARVYDKQLAERVGEYDELQDWTGAAPYVERVKDTQAETIIGVDVQKGYLMVCARRWVAGGESGLLWAGDVPSFERLDKLADSLKAGWIMVDARYRTREVQEWCVDHPGYIPCMGVTRRARSMFTVGTLDLDEGKAGRVAGGGRVIETLEHDSDMVKDALSDLVAGKAGRPAWRIPRDYAGRKDYVSQMTAEQSVNGRWLAIGDKANHYWDAECLSLLGAIRLGMYRLVD